MTEVSVDFAFAENATLESIEEGIRVVESNIKLAMAVMAVALGRIKREGLFYKVAPSFKAYLERERTDLSYQKAIHLAAVGEKFWEFRTQLKAHDIHLSEVMSKVRLLEKDVTETDPMVWDRLQKLSYREFKRHIEKQRGRINVYTEDDFNGDMSASVSVTGKSLAIGGIKLRGLDLGEAAENIRKGKRAIVLWVEDDNEAKRVRRSMRKMGLL